MATMRWPDIWLMTLRRASTAGIAALPGKARPNASIMQAMVDAVPIVLQLPGDRLIAASDARKSSAFMRPAFTSSLRRNMSVPDPSFSPRNMPESIGPPDTTMVGRLQLAAPITSAGVVLSQPTSRTTPSIGLARRVSSTSMLARLRYIIAAGRMLDSPSDITGNSTGKPPASYTPRFTKSARSRRCALQGVSSDQLLQMPITGRPSNRCGGKPWFFIQLR